MDRSDLAIVIPAYNEEGTVAEVVRNVKCKGLVIVVDDCSSDQTSELAKAAGAHVVRHESNRGYDGALNTGFEKAKQLGCKYVITFDADGQHSSKVLDQFIFKLDAGFDLVVGVRPNAARFAEYLYSQITKIFWGLKDPLCGLKGYDMKMYDLNGVFDSCASIGSELAIQSLRKNCSLVQIPIPVADRQEGGSRFGGSISANFKIMKAIVNIVVFKAR